MKRLTGDEKKRICWRFKIMHNYITFLQKEKCMNNKLLQNIISHLEFINSYYDLGIDFDDVPEDLTTREYDCLTSTMKSQVIENFRYYVIYVDLFKKIYKKINSSYFDNIETEIRKINDYHKLKIWNENIDDWNIYLPKFNYVTGRKYRFKVC